MLDVDDIDELCHLADDFESGVVTSSAAAGKTVALLFFQSSTRTRLGFESATVTLGAHADRYGRYVVIPHQCARR